ncbi:MAG: outer membrane beta-barrel protein [Spirochaetaceae bacterium]|jgi:opacity protein-like surface antigen|nr:outer membrane beta-barrel protein [Spirochaetaceae bacterium]
MKRIWAIMVIAVTVGTAAFGHETAAPKKSQAFRMSVGGGGFVSGDFSTWNVDEDVPGDLNRYNATLLGVGPYGFVDFKYVELNVGLAYGKLKNSNADSDLATNPHFPAHTFSLHGSVYFKYPFAISDTFSLFPLTGIDYDLYMLSKKADGRDAKFPISTGTQEASAREALSALSFKLGIGLDTYFTDHLFLRTELLYGIKLPNKMEQYLDDVRQDIDWMLSHGGDFKIAVGYRF